MMRALPILALLAVPAAAQTPHADAGDRPWLPRMAHYCKWITGAGAIALTVLAAREHRHSNEQWNQLLELCRSDQRACVLNSGGRYTNPATEDFYQEALRFDRRARTRLLGGQVALLTTVALFLADLRHGKDGPPNIPFDPLRVTPDPATGRVRLGLHLAF